MLVVPVLASPAPVPDPVLVEVTPELVGAAKISATAPPAASLSNACNSAGRPMLVAETDIGNLVKNRIY